MKTAPQWLLVVALASMAHAQTGGAAIRPIGVVTTVDASAGHILIKTDAGPEMLVVFDEQTAFLRVAPGERDLKTAARIAVSDVGPGDRILARGLVSADAKGVLASSVIVMAKADIASKQAAERAEWERRGIGGIVKAVNPGAKEITVSVPGIAGARTVTIALAEGASVRRYAPDSVKFSDAQPSRLDEIQAGDQVKALGNQSEDETRFTAEELVSGSFLSIAATIDTVDPEAGTLQVTDLATKKQLRVRVNADSNLRRLPPFAAQMLAMGNVGARPAPEGPRSGPATRNGNMPQRPRDLQSMLERMPAFALAELKRGDAIAVASTRGADPTQITAITILAGVEPLLTAAPEGGRQMTGAWNLDLNMNMP